MIRAPAHHRPEGWITPSHPLEVPLVPAPLPKQQLRVRMKWEFTDSAIGYVCVVTDSETLNNLVAFDPQSQREEVLVDETFILIPGEELEGGVGGKLSEELA